MNTCVNINRDRCWLYIQYLLLLLETPHRAQFPRKTARPLNQSSRKSTLMAFEGKIKASAADRKHSRAEVSSKGIKHVEIYGQWVYVGWKQLLRK